MGLLKKRRRRLQALLLIVNSRPLNILPATLLLILKSTADLQINYQPLPRDLYHLDALHPSHTFQINLSIVFPKGQCARTQSPRTLAPTVSKLVL